MKRKIEALRALQGLITLVLLMCMIASAGMLETCNNDEIGAIYGLMWICFGTSTLILLILECTIRHYKNKVTMLEQRESLNDVFSSLDQRQGYNVELGKCGFTVFKMLH